MNREFPYPLGRGTKATAKARREQRPTRKGSRPQASSDSHGDPRQVMNLQTSSLDIHTKVVRVNFHQNIWGKSTQIHYWNMNLQTL